MQHITHQHLRVQLIPTATSWENMFFIVTHAKYLLSKPTVFLTFSPRRYLGYVTGTRMCTLYCDAYWILDVHLSRGVSGRDKIARFWKRTRFVRVNQRILNVQLWHWAIRCSVNDGTAFFRSNDLLNENMWCGNLYTLIRSHNYRITVHHVVHH